MPHFTLAKDTPNAPVSSERQYSHDMRARHPQVRVLCAHFPSTVTIIVLIVVWVTSAEENEKPGCDFGLVAAVAKHFRLGDVLILSDKKMLSSSSWRRKLYDFRRNSSIPVASTIVSAVDNDNDGGVVSSAALIIAVLSGEEALKDLKVPRNRGSKDSVLLLYLPEEVYSNVTSSSPDWHDQLLNVLSPLDISYDSELFIVHPDGSDSGILDLWEVYGGVGPVGQDYVVDHFARWNYVEEGSGEKALEVFGDESIWYRRADLRGRMFNLTARDNIPFVTKAIDLCSSILYQHETPSASPAPCMEGMFAEVFLELQKLMNFSFLLKVPPDQQYGSRLEDGAWNGMIGMILNGDADMSASDFTLSKERAAYVDFLTPLTETHLRLIIKNPSDSTNWGAYINPLTWRAWFLVFTIATLLPLVLAAFVLMGSESQSHHFSLSRCFLFFGTVTFLNRGWNPEPDSISVRIVFFSGLAAGAIIYYYWEASIISFLAVRTIALPFDSLKDLLENTDTKIILQSGTAFVDTFRYSNDSLFQRVWKERMEPVQEHFSTSKTEMGETVVASGGDLAMMDNFQARQFREDYRTCNLIDVDRPYVPDKNAFIIKKDSPYREAFMFHLHLMDERGALGKIMAQYRPPPQECPDYSGRPLGASQCLFAFAALAAGAAAAAALFLAESCFHIAGRKIFYVHRNRHALSYHLAQEKFHSAMISKIRSNIRR